MTHYLRLLALLAVVTVIALQLPVVRAQSAEQSSQHSAAPASSRATPDTVIIQARKEQEIKHQITRFVSGGVAILRHDSLQRWQEPICPAVAGLPSQSAEFILKRMLEIAKDADAPFGSAGCQPNLVVVASNDPDQLVEHWRKRFRGLFNDCRGTGPMKQFIHSHGSRSDNLLTTLQWLHWLKSAPNPTRAQHPVSSICLRDLTLHPWN